MDYIDPSLIPMSYSSNRNALPRNVNRKKKRLLYVHHGLQISIYCDTRATILNIHDAQGLQHDVLHGLQYYLKNIKQLTLFKRPTNLH
jgi:hypothetical protein